MRVANTGGLLGLFMGFSVVSIVEIVYFATLRPYCAARRAREPTQRRRRRQRRHGRQSQQAIDTISKSVADGRPTVVRPFVVKYQHVSRRLCDMGLTDRRDRDLMG